MASGYLLLTAHSLLLTTILEFTWSYYLEAYGETCHVYETHYFEDEHWGAVDGRKKTAQLRNLLLETTSPRIACYCD